MRTTCLGFANTQCIPAVLLSTGIVFCVLALAASGAHAQQIGKDGWQPSPRSNSLSAQFEFQKRHNSSGGGGLDALTQYYTNYNTSSTSIGNYTEVIQSLGEGATGSVVQNTTQESSGTQQSDASSQDSMTNNGSFNPIAESAGTNANNPILGGGTLGD